MPEVLKRNDFYEAGRRICIVETEVENQVQGGNLVANAKKCPFRQSCAVSFKEKSFAGLEFAECHHPDKEAVNFLTDYCPPMKIRINEEPGG